MSRIKSNNDQFESLILVINVGSTSVKWKLFAKRGLDVRGQGEFDRPCDFAAVTKSILRTVGNTARLSSIVHRIVHGGGRFSIERIHNSLLKEIHSFDHLAPLHNPPALECAQYFIEYMPGVPQWAVFDSGFFMDLPEVARTYALPKALSERYAIRRFGFHGISHEYACQDAAKKLKKTFSSLTLISIHLGGGDSVCLVHQGKPLDTSMGFTPLEGLPMMTRSGDLDPGIMFFLLRNHGYSPEGLEHILNEESGLKGLSGEDDFLELLHKRNTDPNAQLALDLFVYHVRKYIGAYCAASPVKPDAIVFTGQIGSGEPFVREAVMKDLWIAKGVKMVTVPADEELAMARKIQALGVRN